MRTWIFGWLVLALTVIAFTLFAAQRVSAQTGIPSGDSLASVSATSTTPVFFSGNAVKLSDTVLASPFLFASQVQQTGTVSGDLVALAGSTVLSGVVEQDVYVATGTFFLDGHIQGNLYVLAGEVILKPGAHIDGSVVIVAERLDVAGLIGDSLQVWARDLVIQDTSRLATVSGQVQTMTQDSQAQIQNMTLLKVKPASERKAHRTFGQIAQLVLWEAVQSAFLAGLLWFATKNIWSGVAQYVPNKLQSVWAWGLTLGLLWPPIALIFLATLLGFPFMVIGTGVWLTFLWIGWLVPVLALVSWLPAREWQIPRFLTSILLGALWGALMALPVAGWVIRILSGLFGLGVFVSYLWQNRVSMVSTRAKK